ncbi:MAG: hypothetical protein ACXV6K_09210 [Halobacteriota archaeon]
MPCKAEERTLAEMRRRRLEAAHHVQLETTTAESELLRSQRIYDWGAVRIAEAMMRCWDSRCAQAEDALTRCKERERNRKAVARFN